MKKQKLFKHVYMYGFLLLFCLSLLFLSINLFQTYHNFTTTSTKMRHEYMLSQQNLLIWKVHHFTQLIEKKQTATDQKIRELLKSKVAFAHGIATSLYEENKEKMAVEEIQRLIVSALRPMRYMGEYGYYFITRLDGLEILFADRPELEGKNLLNLSSDSGFKPIPKMLSLVKTKGEGFYNYEWSKPNEDGFKFQKVSYLKLFEPFGWMIGTGLYEEDIRSEAQREVLEQVESISFDPNGDNYLFIGRWDGTALTHPAKGQNMYDVQDANGKYLVRELIEKAKKGTGFVEYVMPDLGEARTLNKLSYVQGIPEWQWYVGAGVYTDDIEEMIATHFNEIKKEFLHSLVYAFILFVLAIFIMLWFFKRFNEKIEQDFDAFFNFFDSLAHYNYPIDKSHLRFLEFDTLATSANAMLMEKLNLEKKLAHLAHHDALTSLPNRALLKDRIEQGIITAKREKSLLALCFIDLDNFKKINDSFGHSYGDEALLQVVNRIQSTLRETDTMARLGGDEFVLVLEHIDHKDQAALILKKIQKTFEAAFTIHQQTFFFTSSIGVSFYPIDGEDAEMLLKNADLAMYKAKVGGKNNFCFYERALSSASLEILTIENELKSAIANKEFEVYYQPQIDLHTGKCVGLEALLRWNHPQQGVLGPNRFIAYAEESRMILPIGAFVLKQACLDLVALEKTLGFKGKVSVNVSGVQLEHDDFMDTLQDALTQTNINPSALELEITESVFMKDALRWITILENIRALGVKIAIDDFGTGYSSLSYLRRLPVDKLKIDISFVRDLPEHKDARAIAKAIIVLAKSMQMRTLAEGIETSEQANFLIQEECDEGQGFYYQKAVNFSSLVAWLVAKNG